MAQKARPTGKRIEVVPYGKKKEWTYKVYARNGRLIDKAEEGFGDSGYAKKRAEAAYPGYLVWQLVKGVWHQLS